MELWIRFYLSVLNEPKIMLLPPEQYRFWTFCLLLAKESNGKLPQMKNIAYRTRISIDEAGAMVDALVSSELIDRCDDGLYVHMWEWYQPPSSTERVRAYRQRRSPTSTNETHETHETVSRVSSMLHETPMKRAGNADETRRVEKSREEKKELPLTPSSENLFSAEADRVQATIERIHERHPAHRRSTLDETARAITVFLDGAVNPVEILTALDTRHAGWCATGQWRKRGGEYCPGLSRWITSGSCMSEPPAGADDDDEWMRLLGLREGSPQ